MASPVTAIAAATPSDAVAHFVRKLALETDCADVFAALREGTRDFALLDVRDAATYARAHVPGAINLPYRDITAERRIDWPHDLLFVVYGAGPHCNDADKAALKLARLGRPVKLMLGGITGWANEGFAFEASTEVEA